MGLMNGKVRHIKVTLKPVGDGCNLVCEHCFVAGEPRKVIRKGMKKVGLV